MTPLLCWVRLGSLRGPQDPPLVPTFFGPVSHDSLPPSLSSSSVSPRSPSRVPSGPYHRPVPPPGASFTQTSAWLPRSPPPCFGWKATFSGGASALTFSLKFVTSLPRGITAHPPHCSPLYSAPFKKNKNKTITFAFYHSR